jgi:hypothetical protein
VKKLVFLDSRDLIDCVEKHQPCGARRLADDLRRRDSQLILTFTNVLESLPKGTDPAYVVEFARRLESMPHVFVPHTNIATFEFKEAAVAYREGRQPRHELPLMPTWARYVSTYAPGPRVSEAQLKVLDAVPLSERVRGWVSQGMCLEFDATHRARIDATIAQNRAVLGAKRPTKSSLTAFIEGQLRITGEDVGNVSAFVKWLYRDASICPGWRLMEEASQEFRCDVGTPVANGDLPDLTHLYLVPYVRAATLDRKWREYVGRVERRLATQDVPTSYRIYSDLRDLRAGIRDVTPKYSSQPRHAVR